MPSLHGDTSSKLEPLLKICHKGSQSITYFLQTVKAGADELPILGAPIDVDDLMDKILDGLGDDFKVLVRAVQARDTSISFDALHEKLLNFESLFKVQNLNLHTFQLRQILQAAPS